MQNKTGDLLAGGGERVEVEKIFQVIFHDSSTNSESPRRLLRKEVLSLTLSTLRDKRTYMTVNRSISFVFMSWYKCNRNPVIHQIYTAEEKFYTVPLTTHTLRNKLRHKAHRFTCKLMEIRKRNKWAIIPVRKDGSDRVERYRTNLKAWGSFLQWKLKMQPQHNSIFILQLWTFTLKLCLGHNEVKL
jgi:hypothetical protein